MAARLEPHMERDPGRPGRKHWPCSSPVRADRCPQRVPRSRLLSAESPGGSERRVRSSPCGSAEQIRHPLDNFSERILGSEHNSKIARALKNASVEEIGDCFASVQSNLVEFARHPAANYAMQMLFKVAPGELLGHALPKLFSPESIVQSCTHENSNFVIQTFLEVAPVDICVAAIEQMFSCPGILISIGNHRVGNNVIQAAIRACPNNDEGDRLCDSFADPQVLRALCNNKHGMHCLRGLLDVRTRPSPVCVRYSGQIGWN